MASRREVQTNKPPLPMLYSLMLAVLLTAVTADNHVAKDFFGGNNHVDYLSWFEDAQGDYDEAFFIPHTSDPSLGTSLHWKIENDVLHLAVAVRATGWMAFGISENGGMAGSDMFVLEAAKPDEVQDMYAMAYERPIVDECNDWKLVSSTMEGEFLIAQVQRKLDTGDTQDRRIIDDGIVDLPPTFVISAWGDTQTMQFHQQNFARGRVRFFNDGNAGEDEFHQIMDAEADSVFEMFARQHVISSEATEYADICFTWNDLLAMNIPPAGNFSVIGFEPVIDRAEHVHHFTLFGSTNDMNGHPCEDFEEHLDLVYGWGPGETSQPLPDDVGLTIGADSYKSFRLEIHYNNPELKEGQVDSSGIRFYYSNQRRKLELGLVQIGDPTVYLENREIRAGLTEYWFDCPSSCTESMLSQDVTVLREYMHMHSLGQTMKLEQIRDGEVIHTGSVEFFDFDQQGNQLVLQGPYTIKKGDAFRTTCTYDARSGDKFGFGAKDEMCIAFIMYYPKQSYLNGLVPWFCDPDPEAGFKPCLSTTENRTLTEIPKIFGTPKDECSVPLDSEATTSGVHGIATTSVAAWRWILQLA